MAEVYLAYDEHGQTVAIKRLLAPYCANEAFKAMFIDEARIGTLLSHPNVARIIELGEHEGQLYLVMEHVDGRDLLQPSFGIGQRLGEPGEGLPLGMVIHIASGVAAGLAYAHSLCDSRGEPRGIVHRDVSPANILVGFDGIPRVIDFGIAKARDRLAQTMGDVVKGKFAYMSPEQLNGQPVDGRSDIFALGAVIYALLTGREAFAGENQLVTIQRVSLAQVAPPSSFKPELPAEVDALVARALAREPADRYQAAEELRRDLLTVAVEKGVRFGAMAMSAWMYDSFDDEGEKEQDDSISDAQRALSASARLGPVSQPLPALSTSDLDIDAYDATQLATPEQRQLQTEGEQPAAGADELAATDRTVLDRDAAQSIRAKLGAIAAPALSEADVHEKTVRRVGPKFTDAASAKQPGEAAQQRDSSGWREPSGADSTRSGGFSPEQTDAQPTLLGMPDEDLWGEEDSQTRATLDYADGVAAGAGLPGLAQGDAEDEDDPIELLRRAADDELSGRVDWQPQVVVEQDEAAADRTVAHFSDATAPTKTEEATVARLPDDDDHDHDIGATDASSGFDNDDTADLGALEDTAALPNFDPPTSREPPLPPQAYRDDAPRSRPPRDSEDESEDDEDLLGGDSGPEQTLTGGEALSSLLDDDDDEDEDDERLDGERSDGEAAAAAAAAAPATERAPREYDAREDEAAPAPAAVGEQSALPWIVLLLVLLGAAVAALIYLLRG